MAVSIARDAVTFFSTVTSSIPQLPPLIDPQLDKEFEAGAANPTEQREFLGCVGGGQSVQEQWCMTHFCSRMQ